MSKCPSQQQVNVPHPTNSTNVLHSALNRQWHLLGPVGGVRTLTSSRKILEALFSASWNHSSNESVSINHQPLWFYSQNDIKIACCWPNRFLTNSIWNIFNLHIVDALHVSNPYFYSNKRSAHWLHNSGADTPTLYCDMVRPWVCRPQSHRMESQCTGILTWATDVMIAVTESPFQLLNLQICMYMQDNHVKLSTLASVSPFGFPSCGYESFSDDSYQRRTHSSCVIVVFQM